MQLESSEVERISNRQGWGEPSNRMEPEPTCAMSSKWSCRPSVASSEWSCRPSVASSEWSCRPSVASSEWSCRPSVASSEWSCRPSVASSEWSWSRNASRRVPCGVATPNDESRSPAKPSHREFYCGGPRVCGVVLVASLSQYSNKH